MVSVKLTPQLKDACLTAYNSAIDETTIKRKIGAKLGINNILSNSGENESISNFDDEIELDLIKQISISLLAWEKENGVDIAKSKYWVHELLRGSSLHFPTIKSTKKSENTEARLQSVARDQQNRDYYRMVQNVDPRFQFRETPRDDMENSNVNLIQTARETNQQLTAIFNIALTIVAVFVAIYWVSYAYSDDVSFRVLISLFGAIIVGIAETFLYVRYLNNRASQLRPL